MQISIDSGLKSYDILDPDGNLTGTIRFNPGDPGIPARWKQAEADIQALQGHTRQLCQEVTTTEEQAKIILDADAKVKSCIDYAMGAPVSEVLFGGQSCFGICADGQMVLEHVLNSLEPVIVDAQKNSVRQVAERAATYTARYSAPEAGLAPDQKVCFSEPEGS